MGSKTEIHRMFSSQGNVRSRSVPRIFLFDCCDGSEDMKNVLPLRTLIALPSQSPSVAEESELNDIEEEKEEEKEAVPEEDDVAVDELNEEKAADVLMNESEEEEEKEKEMRRFYEEVLEAVPDINERRLFCRAAMWRLSRKRRRL